MYIFFVSHCYSIVFIPECLYSELLKSYSSEQIQNAFLQFHALHSTYNYSTIEDEQQRQNLLQQYLDILKNSKEEISKTDLSMKLYSGILHKGKSVTSGHYVSVCKENDEWYLYNDSKVF